MQKDAAPSTVNLYTKKRAGSGSFLCFSVEEIQQKRTFLYNVGNKCFGIIMKRISRSKLNGNAPELKQMQQGMVAILFVFFIFLAVLSGFTYYFLIEMRKDINRERAEAASYILSVRDNLESWYDANAAHIDLKFVPNLDKLYTNESQFKTADEILEKLEREYPGEKKYGVRFVVSPESCTSVNTVLGNSTVCYKQLAAYLPDMNKEDMTPPEFVKKQNSKLYAFDNKGIEHYVVLSGMDLQLKKINDTMHKMKDNAERLEIFGRARFQADPSHDLVYNYFKAEDCGNPQEGEIHCSHGFVKFEKEEDIKKQGHHAMYGLTLADMYNAWGMPVYFNNDNNGGKLNGKRYNLTQVADIYMPPYSAVYSTVTPWGSIISIKAVQIIN